MVVIAAEGSVQKSDASVGLLLAVVTFVLLLWPQPNFLLRRLLLLRWLLEAG